MELNLYLVNEMICDYKGKW